MNQIITLDLDKALSSKIIPSHIRKAAEMLSKDGWLPAGDYFAALSDVEVLELALAMQSAFNPAMRNSRSDNDLHNLSLLYFILAAGEGEVEMLESELISNINRLFMLISTEALHREGKADVYRKNYSVLDGSRNIGKVK